MKNLLTIKKTVSLLAAVSLLASACVSVSAAVVEDSNRAAHMQIMVPDESYTARNFQTWTAAQGKSVEDGKAAVGDLAQRCIYYADGSRWGIWQNNADNSSWASVGYAADDAALKAIVSGSYQSIFFKPANAVAANTADELVVGLNSNQTTTLTVFSNNGAGTGDQWTDGNAKSIEVQAGYNVYHIDISNWTSEYNMLGFKTGENVTDLLLQFTYMEFNRKDTVEDRTAGTVIDNGAADYDVNNNAVDLILPSGKYFNGNNWSSVTKENVLINGQPVQDIAHGGTWSRIRAYLGNLQPGREYTISFNNVNYLDGSAITDTFTFTTAKTDFVSASAERTSFNEGKGDPADVYKATIDYGANNVTGGLEWVLTKNDNAKAKVGVTADLTEISGGSVQFGIIVSGTTEELASISGVTLEAATVE